MYYDVVKILLGFWICIMINTTLLVRMLARILYDFKKTLARIYHDFFKIISRIFGRMLLTFY